jgi:hypothetical protein
MGWHQKLSIDDMMGYWEQIFTTYCQQLPEHSFRIIPEEERDNVGTDLVFQIGPYKFAIHVS